MQIPTILILFNLLNGAWAVPITNCEPIIDKILCTSSFKPLTALHVLLPVLRKNQKFRVIIKFCNVSTSMTSVVPVQALAITTHPENDVINFLICFFNRFSLRVRYTIGDSFFANQIFFLHHVGIYYILTPQVQYLYLVLVLVKANSYEHLFLLTGTTRYQYV